MIHIILLSGGSGTRLWPLSNNARSKQFLKVLRDPNGDPESMVQRTHRMLSKVLTGIDITIATCESQVGSIEKQIGGDYSVVIEPERRDTAPAIMLACAYLAYSRNISLEDTVVVMPIDTYTQEEYYKKIEHLDIAVQSSSADLVLLGVEPTFASIKYGYIVPDSSEGEIRHVKKFVEKPEKRVAEQLIEAGALWNCGVFAFRLRYLVSLLSKYTQLDAFEEIRNNYCALPKNSFDYEVVEKASSIAVVPCECDWKDLGTWNTLSEEMTDSYAGRVVVDEETCSNTHVINETGLPLVVSGMDNAIIVATPDGILVSGKQESAYIKPHIEKAAVSRPMFETRRWGEYRVVDSGVYPDGHRALTKELVIKAGKQLSYQLHERRSEVWTIVSGEGEVVIDGDVAKIKAGDVVEIPAEKKHSLRAFNDVHAIEVQIGDELIEEDIERFGNYWD